jgi:hypothetical protein
MFMDKHGKSGKYWYSAEHVSEIQEMIGYLRGVHDYIKEIPKYRPVKEALFLRDATFDEVSQMFPRLEIFRNKYGMDKRMTYLEYKGRHTYLNLPHDHESIETTIFFPIRYSDHAGTAFFEPTPEQTIEIKPLKLGLALGDPPSKPRYSCPIDTVPVEVAGGNRPMVFKTDVLHNAYEIDIGHPDNYQRVSVAWDSKLPFQTMVASLSDG